MILEMTKGRAMDAGRRASIPTICRHKIALTTSINTFGGGFRGRQGICSEIRKRSRCWIGKDGRTQIGTELETGHNGRRHRRVCASN